MPVVRDSSPVAMFNCTEPTVPLEERQKRGETFVARNRRVVDPGEQFVREREPFPVVARAPGGRGGHGILPELDHGFTKR